MNWKISPIYLALGLTFSLFSASSEAQPSEAKDTETSSNFLTANSHCTVSQNKPRSKKVDPDRNLDGERFVEVLREMLPLDEHMGYVVIVQNSALRNVATDTSGYAISNCDPGGPEAFTVDTRTAWGSVSKLITTAVVANRAQESNQVSLGDRFAPHIPNRWRLHSRFTEVTFAQLLGHRAGLRRSSGVDLRTRLATTNNDPPVGERSYSNTGHGIAGRMIMIATGNSQGWESQYANAPQQEYDDWFNSWASLLYLGFAESQVLAPANVNDASCGFDQYVEEGKPYARRYSSGSDPNGRLKPDARLSCFSGGWVMSARQMARFMRTLRHTNAIVNRTTYGNMTACRLGFDGGGGAYVQGPAFHKNGLIRDNQGNRYSAYVVMLPGGYTAVAASNSGSPISLRDAVREAFNASYSPPTASPVQAQIRARLGGRCVYW